MLCEHWGQQAGFLSTVLYTGKIQMKELLDQKKSGEQMSAL